MGESGRNQGAGLSETFPHTSWGEFPEFLSEAALRELALLGMTTCVLLTKEKGPLQRRKGKWDKKEKAWLKVSWTGC